MLSPSGLDAMRASRELVDRGDTGRSVYGVTTGLGARAGEDPDADTLVAFSKTTIRGRAHAVGGRMPADQVRATLLVRLNTLLTGYSGARPDICGIS